MSGADKPTGFGLSRFYTKTSPLSYKVN